MVGPEVFAADGFLEANERITPPLFIDFLFGPVVAVGWIGHGMTHEPVGVGFQKVGTPTGPYVFGCISYRFADRQHVPRVSLHDLVEDDLGHVFDPLPAHVSMGRCGPWHSLADGATALARAPSRLAQGRSDQLEGWQS